MHLLSILMILVHKAPTFWYIISYLQSMYHRITFILADDDYKIVIESFQQIIIVVFHSCSLYIILVNKSQRLFIFEVCYKY